MSARLEADMYSELANWLVACADDSPKFWGDRRDPFQIVHAVEEAARRSDFTHLSIAELCAAAGVAKTRLHECFAEVYGVSPSIYLRRQRLSVARDWLSDTNAPPLSVKDAALRFGFCNLGRFAADYQTIYGEYPHETLERTGSSRPNDRESDSQLIT